MNPAGAYTPLECLLLFQSLVAFGTREEDFVQISNLLTNNSLVKDGETYDGRRLTVHALKDLYTRLLRDEVNADAQDVDDSNPKKRKLQSPTLSLQDVEEYGDKLPVVVDRLYARYRLYMVHAIREDERRFAIVEREIAEIERGQRDDRLLMQQKPVNGSPSVGTLATKTNGVTSLPTQQLPAGRLSISQPVPQRHDESAPSPAASKHDRHASPKPVDRKQSSSQTGIVPHARTPSAGPHGPSPLQTGHQPIHNGQLPPPQNFAWVPAYQPGQQPGHPQYNAHYPNQYPHQQPPPRGPTQSPLIPPTYGAVPSSPMNSSHPQYPQHQINTPQPSHRGSPASPAPPYQHVQENNGHMQQPQGQAHPQSPHHPPYRSNSGSPMVPPGGLGYPPHFVAPRPSSATGGQFQQWPQGNLPPQPSHFPPNYQQYPVSQNQQQYPVPQQRFVPSQTNPQVPGNAYSSPYEHGTTPQVLLRGQNQQLPSTPKVRPAANATGFGTKWTPTPTGRTPGEYQQVRRPVMEAISPVMAKVQLPTSQQETPKPVKIPSTSKRTSQPHSGSNATPAVAELPTNQVDLSSRDELSFDEAVTQQVKEEVNTPRGIEEVGDLNVDGQSSQAQPNSTALSRTSLKRKRAHSKVETHPHQVEWTRNFPVISRSALDQITAHKHGGMFALPVKERDAPGYKDLIKRPQDFKTIRASVIAGNRAANAAATEMDVSPNATSVWLPISEDLISPKGIVNSAQFEKEVMRVFANAVMFNPDPDRSICKRWDRAMEQDEQGVIGYAIDEDTVVKDTKVIFTDAELILENLRAAERRSEEVEGSEKDEDDDRDELGDAGDHGNVSVIGGSVAKRRRKG